MRVFGFVKKHKILTVIITTILLGWCFVQYMASPYGLRIPFKVTDPAHANFDPTKFRFEDYGTPQEITDALHQMFPVGTHIDEIEKILLDIEGVEKFHRTFKEKIHRKELGEKYSYSQIYIYEPTNFLTRLPFNIRATLALNPTEVYRVIIGFDKQNRLLFLRVKY